MINKISQVLRSDYKALIADLKMIKHHTRHVTETDIRLCVDINDDGEVSWIIRWGDVSYDQRHSLYCSASGITTESNLDSILKGLIDQLLDQVAESESIA